jgi:hypothetical protein
LNLTGRRQDQDGGGGGATAAAGVVAKLRARRLWGVAARAVRDGRVARLIGSPDYDPVSAMFRGLFPREFDRAIPVHDYRR